MNVPAAEVPANIVMRPTYIHNIIIIIMCVAIRLL